MVEFASRWPDMRSWAIERLEKRWPDKKISAERDESLSEQIVVSATPAQLETTISRAHLITTEVWAPTKKAGFDLCADAAFELVSAPRKRPVVRTEPNAGPNEQRDEAGNYYYDATSLIVAHRV